MYMLFNNIRYFETVVEFTMHAIIQRCALKCNHIYQYIFVLITKVLCKNLESFIIFTVNIGKME